MTDPRAQPTLFVPLIGVPAFLIFFAGGIAFALLQLRAAEQVKPGTMPAAWLLDESKVPNGTFVEVEETFVSSGEESVWIDGQPAIFVTALAPVTIGTPSRVRGRVCNRDNAAMCKTKTPEVQSRVRLFAAGMTPDDVRASATKGWLSAIVAVIVYIGFVVFSRRRRQGPSRAFEERVWTLPYGAEEIAARVRKLEGEDRFCVVDEGPGRLVFIQGYSENAARGWGIRKPDVFPRRATLTWKSSPREPTQVSARVEEDLVWWPSPLTATMDRLARASIASSLARIENALGVR